MYDQYEEKSPIQMSLSTDKQEQQQVIYTHCYSTQKQIKSRKATGLTQTPLFAVTLSFLIFRVSSPLNHLVSWF